jgi:hypothetical protein
MDGSWIERTNGPLPPLYARWMGELLEGPIPSEPQATCDDCAMCTDGREHAVGGYFFEPDVKCCSYLPDLPSFLVGRALADDTPKSAAGRRTMEERLATCVAVTPLGVGVAPLQRAVYGIVTDRGGFGRDPTVRCPHLVEDGSCGIWRHRNGVCSTWFCKHERGAVGYAFWQTLMRLFSFAEAGLARWCALEGGLPDEVLASLYPSTIDLEAGEGPRPERVHGVVGEATYAALWGEWQGREAAWYVECARRVEPLAWSEVEGIVGAELRLWSRLVARAHARLGEGALPTRLAPGPYEVVGSDAEHMRVRAYSPLDPLEVPKDLLDVLHHFDGAPTEEALERIALEEGLELDPGVLRQLCDFAILRERRGGAQEA